MEIRKNIRPIAEKQDFVFGTHPVSEILDTDKEIDRILIQVNLKAKLFPEIKAQIHGRDIIVQYVPKAKLDRVTRKNHQGIIAFISPVAYHKIEDIVFSLYNEGIDPKILMLDGLTDVRNFGAISRSAECFGYNAIVIPNTGGVRITPDAIKTSAGALNKLPICRVGNVVKTAREMQSSGLKIIACTEKGDIPIQEANLSGPLLVIMGNEERGISSDLLKMADIKALINMPGTLQSLNVSVAAGIIMFMTTINN